MNMKPDTPQNAAAAPGRTWVRRGLVVLGGSLLLSVMAIGLLNTQAGQRWAISFVIEQAANALGGPGAPVSIRLDRVGLNWSPFGLALEGLELHDSGEGELRFCRIQSATLQPVGRTGTHWSNIGLAGIDITPSGLEWLQGLQQGGQTKQDSAVEFRIDALHLREIRFPLDPSWIPDGRQHDLWVDAVTATGLDFSSIDPIRSGHGEIRLVSRSDEGSSDTSRFSLDWALDEITGHVELEPSTWLASVVEDDTGMLTSLPAAWTVRCNWRNAEATILGDAPWCSLGVELDWRDSALTLDRVWLDYQEIPFPSTEWMPTSGRLDVKGPLTWPLSPVSDSVGNPPGWAALTGQPQIAWTGKGGPLAAGRGLLEWDLLTGDLKVEGKLQPDIIDSPLEVDWDLEGQFVPLAVLAKPEAFPALSLMGRCNAAVSGDMAGSGSTGGAVAFEAQFSESGVDATLSLEARSAPLVITEGLELHGPWTLNAAADWDRDGSVESWWSNLTVTGATLIPLPGFDGRTRQGSPLSMRRLMLMGRGDAQRFDLDLEGDFIRGHAEGPYDPDSWVRPLAQALESGGLLDIGPVEDWLGPMAPLEEAGRWQLDLTLSRNDLLERFSHDQWSVGPGSHVVLSHVDGLLDFDLDLNALHLGPVNSDAFNIQGQGGNTPLSLEASATNLAYRGWATLDRFTVSAQAPFDSVSVIRMDWDGMIAGFLAFEHVFGPTRGHVVRPMQLDWTYEGAQWSLAPGTAPTFTWSGPVDSALDIRDFKLMGEQGSIAIGNPGLRSDDRKDMLIELDHFPVGPWLDLLEAPLAMDLPEGSGLINSAVELRLSPLEIAGTVQWIDAVVENIHLGDVCLSADWSGDDPKIQLQQFQGEREVLRASNRGDAGLLVIALDDWPLESLQPQLDAFGVHVEGRINDTISLPLLSGMESELSGRVSVDIDRLTVDATGMTYALQGGLQLGPGYLGMDQAKLLDRDGHEAAVNLSVLHDGWTDWNYDIGLDLPETFNVMDVKPNPGALFYGQVMATGDANVFGSSEAMEVQAQVRSMPGTRFTMPLGAIGGPEMPSGIRFIGGASPGPTAPNEQAFGVSLDLVVEVTPDAFLSLILDGQQAEERVEGRASGSLSIVKNESQSLFMQGGLEIESGQYSFSFWDLFTKNIAIAPGGRIDWDGNPYDAGLSLLAVDPVKTNPLPLLPRMVDPGKTDVEVGLGIFGNLTAPLFDFSVSFPEYERSNASMLAQLNAALSTPEETERQALALLATGQFIPPDQQNAQLIGMTAAAQASDLLSTGVSELLSNLSEEVNIGVRYLPSTSGPADPDNLSGGSDLQSIRTEDGFEMDLGVNLLNDRLRISGTLGAQSGEGPSGEQDKLQRAFDVRYQLTPDGRWELIGYQKPESALDPQPIRGIGAVYQVRFDRLSELFLRSRPAKQQ